MQKWVVGRLDGAADVQYRQPGANGARDRVDGGCPGAELRDHGRGDLLWPRRDALGMNAVVGCRYHDGRAVRDRRRADAGDAGQTRTEGLQPSEAAGGLYQRALPDARCCCGMGGDWRDAVEQLLDVLWQRHVSFLVSAWARPPAG